MVTRAISVIPSEYNQARLTLSAIYPAKIGPAAYVRAYAVPIKPRSRKDAPNFWAYRGMK